MVGEVGKVTETKKKKIGNGTNNCAQNADRKLPGTKFPVC
jgi:hypothetical protein